LNLFEKLIMDNGVLEEQDILYKYQFGFLKNRSTAMAVIELIDNISNLSIGIIMFDES